MRKDMSKVVIERPRNGHSLRNSKTRLHIRHFNYDLDYEEDFDDLLDNLPPRVSGSRSKFMRETRTKYFSDLIGPLQRFLRSNVGRPWNKVYSEMREHLDTRKTTGNHVFEHLEGEVSTNCYEEGRMIYSYDLSNKLAVPVYGFYVHPRTGLLCWKDRERRKKPKGAKESTRVRINRRHYIKLNGVWYIAELKSPSAFSEGGSQQALFVDHHSTQWLVMQKKQCNSKELKAAGLKNDSIDSGPQS